MRQKIGTILFVLIVVVGLTITFLFRRASSVRQDSWQVDSVVVSMFQDSMLRLDSIYASKWANNRKYQQEKNISSPSLPALDRHPFDPNTSDSIDLLLQGFRPWQVRNMLKYRSKGGRWRKPDDLLKIYGVDSSFFAQIEPYIQIVDSPLIVSQQESDSVPKLAFLSKKDTIIELNSSDTSSLKLIRGIGSFVAKQIISYRDRLGGYYSVEQLHEIERLPQGTVEKIASSLVVDTMLIKKIDLNRASVQQLAKHPYIRAEKAKQIYNLRRNKLKIKDFDELIRNNVLTADEMEYLMPYLELK